MSNRDYVCRNLAFSAWLDGKNVVIHLEDPLAMTEAQVSHEMGMSTLNSRAYHLKEGIVIAIRQLIDQGWELGMFKVDVTKLPIPPLAPKERKKPQQSFIDDFMRDDDII